MAITRAQQVKQMLREGGRIGFKNGPAGGASASGNYGGDKSGGYSDKERAENRDRGGPPGRDTVTESPVKDRYGDETEKRLNKIREEFINKPVTIKKIPFGFPGGSFVNMGLKLLEKPLTAGQQFTRDFNVNKVAKAGRYTYTDPKTGKEYTFDEDLALEDPEIFEAANKQLLKDRNAGIVDAYGNPLSQGDGDGMSDYERRLLELEQALKAQAVTPVQTPFTPNLRLLADGGKADDGRIGFFKGAQADASAGKGAMSPGTDTGGGFRGGEGDGPQGPPTNVGGGGITTQISKKNIPTPNTDISKFNVKDLINLGLVDLEDENTQLAKVFNTKKDLIGLGAAKKGFFDTLTPEGKALEKFRKSAVNFKKAEANTANTPQAALNFMQNKPGLFSDVLDNQEFIQSAIDKGFLKDESDYANQKPLGEAVDLRANGGRIGAMEGGMMSPEGGIMDLESGRQMYFLGKLVKKATRAVKKIVKSPIGKAALFASPLLMSSAARSGLASFLFKNPMAKGSGFGGFMEMLRGGMTGGGKFALGAGLTLAPFLFGNEEEKQQPMYQGADIADPNFIMANYSKFTNPRLAAEGGLMRAAYQEGSKEPVAKKTMPLLDMDGKEMDLREEGGFVPIGRMEKADDVPARLSKNEFVFTADAVRNAGDGNVDKGAEVMYNMMKNLESGGDVSEESQGLEGAREMFQTSQRLEEVL